jgi:hypothetical protein
MVEIISRQRSHYLYDNKIIFSQIYWWSNVLYTRQQANFLSISSRFAAENRRQNSELLATSTVSLIECDIYRQHYTWHRSTAQ